MPRLLCAVLSLSVCGCSLFGPHTQSIRISTEPPGAQVVLNGDEIGVAPLDARIPRNKSSSILVRLEGYESVPRVTNESLSTLGVLDIVGGFFLLVPFIGLASPGAYKQGPENLLIVLRKDTSGDTSDQ